MIQNITPPHQNPGISKKHLHHAARKPMNQKDYNHSYKYIEQFYQKNKD